MNLKERKIHIGKKRTISLLSALILVCMLSVTTVFATAYVVLQWTTTATVVANPKVCFGIWTAGTKYNTYDYIVNVFPNAITVDENATRCVYNWDSSSHNVYFRLASTNTNSTDISWFYLKIGASLYSKNQTDLDTPDTTWSTVCSADATTKYVIEIRIKCASGAGVGHTPTFNLEIKVENP